MDFSKFKTNDWLIVGGGAAFLIFGFIDSWAKIDLGFGSTSAGNAFDWFRGWLSMILIIAAAVITFLRVTGKMADGGRQWPLILVIMTGLATLLMLLLVLMGPDKEGIDFGRGFALWVAFLATIAATAGAVMNFLAGGGDFKDLTDMNKLKDAFDGDDDAAATS